MSAKITVNTLAERLAIAGNVTEETARGFLTALFAEIAAQLEQGKDVKIKSIGTFSADGGFTPDTALADAVNAPFSFFEPVELASEVTDEMLISLDTSVQADASQAIVDEQISDAQGEVVEEEQQDNSEAEFTSEPSDYDIPSEIQQPGDIEDAHTDVDEEHIAPEETHLSTTHQNRWALPLAFGLCGFILGAALMYLLLPSITAPDSLSETLVEHRTDTIFSTDTIVFEPVQQAELAAAITDTVRSGYYFTTMARRHYGDKSFWVYIYEDNASRLQLEHPERIMPGTVVTIPPPEKYGINPDDEESVKTAKAKAYEIYGRFN